MLVSLLHSCGSVTHIQCWLLLIEIKQAHILCIFASMHGLCHLILLLDAYYDVMKNDTFHNVKPLFQNPSLVPVMQC